MDFWELSESVIKKRIEEMNKYESFVKGVYRISKAFILGDFVINIQKELAKNNHKRIFFRENAKICDYEIPFVNPLLIFDDNPEKNAKRFARKALVKKPYEILLKNHQIISLLISSLTFLRRKPLLRLNAYMCSSKCYDKNTLKTFRKIPKDDFKRLVRNFLKVMVAYDSVIRNEDIVNVIRFVAFQLKLTKNSEWKCWEDLFEYCQENCFGFVIGTDEQYCSLMTHRKDSSPFPSSIEEGIIDFEYYMSFMEVLMKGS